MHQEHNIPWNTFTSNFEYVREDRRFTPPRSGFIPLHRPTQAKELNHFVRKMISTIREFSATERKKYPPACDLKIPENGLLFSDELRDLYPEYLNSRNQKLDYWVESASVVPNATHTSTYSTLNGDLADVVKVLIHKNQMEALLMLANHPYVPLQSLRSLSWGHHFGFHRIVEAALIPYIFWNFMAVSDRLASGDYKSETYERILRGVTSTMDHEAQQIPHWEFYGGRNLGSFDSLTDIPDVEFTRLHQYIKHLFSLLYRYDMLTTECKIDPNWESEIVSSISWYYGVGQRMTEDANGQWIYHF